MEEAESDVGMNVSAELSHPTRRRGAELFPLLVAGRRDRTRTRSFRRLRGGGRSRRRGFRFRLFGDRHGRRIVRRARPATSEGQGSHCDDKHATNRKRHPNSSQHDRRILSRALGKLNRFTQRSLSLRGSAAGRRPSREDPRSSRREAVAGSRKRSARPTRGLSESQANPRSSGESSRHLRR
jgi:hypothetical protein